MPLPPPYKLTSDQIAHFLRYGYLRVPQCFTLAKTLSWTGDVWTRLGYSLTDKSTWAVERINMASHRSESCNTFAPKAWAAICELLGGEERVAEESAHWDDGLIVNLGSEEWEGRWPQPRDLDGWHVDGDFFVHFLDSREQGLLVIPLFTEIREHAGGTMVCPDSIGKLAKYLYDHPEGVSTGMVPRGNPTAQESLDIFAIANDCTEFHDMTGQIGDVILLHPLMLHSASRNSLRIPRIITNPPISLKEPFNFNRDDPRQYSIVEQKTLKELGADRLSSWTIQGGREMLVSERLRVQEDMRKLELKRLGNGT